MQVSEERTCKQRKHQRQGIFREKEFYLLEKMEEIHELF